MPLLSLRLLFIVPYLILPIPTLSFPYNNQAAIERMLQLLRARGATDEELASVQSLIPENSVDTESAPGSAAAKDNSHLQQQQVAADHQHSDHTHDVDVDVDVKDDDNSANNHSCYSPMSDMRDGRVVVNRDADKTVSADNGGGIVSTDAHTEQGESGTMEEIFGRHVDSFYSNPALSGSALSMKSNNSETATLGVNETGTPSGRDKPGRRDIIADVDSFDVNIDDAIGPKVVAAASASKSTVSAAPKAANHGGARRADLLSALTSEGDKRSLFGGDDEKPSLFSGDDDSRRDDVDRSASDDESFQLIDDYCGNNNTGSAAVDSTNAKSVQKGKVPASVPPSFTAGGYLDGAL